jgi:nicotinamidase-related amidase
MDSALIIIDVQESFRQRESWQESSTPDIAARVNRLAEAARDRGDMIVWILHHEPGSGTVFDPLNGHVRLMSEIVAKDTEPVFYKSAHSAFSAPSLQQHLTTAGVHKLTVCGIRTEQCCETTARAASDLGYTVDFVTEATATEPITRDGVTLSTKDIVARTEFVLDGRFARIVTLAQACAR